MDLVEQVLRRVGREDVRHARLNAHAEERQEPLVLPCLCLRELLVAELHARQAVRRRRVRTRERHRHVHVRRPDLEGRVEDLHVVDGLDRVHDQVDVVLLRELDDLILVRRVEAFRDERRCFVDLLLDLLRPVQVHVREHHLLQPRTVLRDDGDRLADAAHSNQQHLHRCAPCISRTGVDGRPRPPPAPGPHRSPPLSSVTRNSSGSSSVIDEAVTGFVLKNVGFLRCQTNINGMPSGGHPASTP